MDLSSEVCSFCHAQITINDEVINCPKCNAVIHYVCAQENGWMCPNFSCRSKLTISPRKIEIVVTGNNAKEVETVSSTLLNRAKTNQGQQKKKTSSKNDKAKSPVEVLVAKYGLSGTVVVAIISLLGTFITAYFGYLSVRAQTEAPIIATQTAESIAGVSTVTLTPSLSNTATTDSFYRIEVTQVAVLRYKVKNDTSIYEQPNISARIIENISVGQEVESLKQDGDWAFITYIVGNVRTTGWIQKKDLEIIK